MTTTLITGANKGLGHETARRLTAAGHTVYVGARNVERGSAAAAALGARFAQLDVTDDASVAAAAATIESHGGLDVLINNAGIEVRSPEGMRGNALANCTVSMLTVVLERINAVEPGYTATDLNRHEGAQTVEQGVEIIVRMAQPGPDGPTGGYFDAAGPLPW
ncbi:SDR family NAD(P)-dependent oxidoreductase [Streptomyces sp. NBC_01358]|uniref:SDR family NAD(P)-dependent oxidoreductase n=1 Tax=Streptomyces sp. NBC_01358 TaxID=2903837 RepID=UPI002E315894|nr:SDR family NAD(P)-dependent oxidoreductase [Streptomyces sp. NBC_01358]